jgi:hypothetical protein
MEVPVRNRDYKAYNSWRAMRMRCNIQSTRQYADYGGRGIKVCQRWDSFLQFLQDMGERPDGHSLDRIDTNGDYTPDNCRWANRQTQNRNTRRNNLIYNNRKVSLSECCEIFNLSYSNTHKALNYRGASIEDIFKGEVKWA